MDDTLPAAPAVSSQPAEPASAERQSAGPEAAEIPEFSSEKAWAGQHSSRGAADDRRSKSERERRQQQDPPGWWRTRNRLGVRNWEMVLIVFVGLVAGVAATIGSSIMGVR